MTPSINWLLIDDDDDDQEIFGLALQRVDKSIRCVFATNGISALENFHADEAFVPDCIFIDMNMPRMNGIQCLNELKKIPRLRPVPVFIYSTFADPAMVADSKRLGATDFIEKPTSIIELAEILTRLI